MQKERIEILLPDQPGMCVWDTVVEEDVEHCATCPCLTRTCPNHGFCAYCRPHHAELNKMIGRMTGIPQHHGSYCQNFKRVRAAELPVGARVRDVKCGDVYLVAQAEESGAVLISSKLTDIAAFDGAEPESEGLISYFGRGDYSLSNIKAWLNSPVTDWYRPSHDTDAPPLTEHLRYGERPYASLPGFLARFSRTFYGALIDGPEGRAFVPSGAELGLEGADGAWELFKGPGFVKTSPEERVLRAQIYELNPPEPGAQPGSPQNYDPAFGWWYWLRDGHPSRNYLARVISPYGALTYTYANNDCVGVRPAMKIRPDTEFYKMTTQGGEIYVIYVPAL